MKNVIGVSLGARQQDFEFRTQLLGQTSARAPPGHRRRPRTKPAVCCGHWDSRADAIGLGLAKDSAATPGERRRRRRSAPPGCVRRSRQAPFSNGARLADIFLEWAVRHAQATLGHYFDNARVLFFSGLAHQKLAMSMAEYTPNLHFADPVLQLGSPKLLTSLDALGLYASGMHYVADWVPRRAGQRHAAGAVGAATCCAAPSATPRWWWRRCTSSTAWAWRNWPARPSSPTPSTTRGWPPSRTRACTWSSTARRWCRAMPSIHRCSTPCCWPPRAGAAAICTTTTTSRSSAAEGMQPRLLYPNGFKRVNRFAFVIHPLSQEYFKKVKPVEVLSRVSPPLLMDSLEKVMAFAPPFVYSQGRGHPLAHRRRSRRLADRGGRHAQGDHEPQPGVHLPAAAGRGRHGAQAGRADHGPGRLHQGRGRCRRHGGAPGAAADHHRQQLQRQRRAVGGARCAAAHAAAAARRAARNA